LTLIVMFLLISGEKVPYYIIQQIV